METIKKWYNYILHNENKIGLFIGVIGFIFAFIAYFYPFQPSPKLNYFVQDTVDVFHLNKPIENLDVYYAKQDIRKDSLNLRLYQITLTNSGGSDIKIGDYADLPFGLMAIGGKIISVKLLEGKSDPYIRNNIHPLITDPVHLNFQKVIIESGKKIVFEILLLHPVKQEPKLIAMGKIAGIDQIKVTTEKAEQSGWYTFFMIIFCIAAFIMGIILLFAIPIYTVAFIMDYFRKRKISSLYDLHNKPITDERKVLIELYMGLGAKQFTKVLHTYKNNEYVERIYSENTQIIKLGKQLEEHANERSNRYTKKELAFQANFFDCLDHLKEANVAEEKEGALIISDRFKSEIDEILELFNR